MKPKTSKLYFLSYLVLLMLSASFKCFAYEEVSAYDLPVEEVFSAKMSANGAADKISLDQNDISIASSHLQPQVLEFDLGQQQVNFDLSKVIFDWTTVLEFNYKANEIWHSLKNCTSGDPEIARNWYRDGLLDRCNNVHESLIQLKNNIRNFLDTAYAGTAQIGRALKCVKGPNCTQMHNELWRVETKFAEKNPVLLINRVLANAQRPRLHPLLTQLLLEDAALGFTFSYAAWSTERCPLFFSKCLSSKKTIHQTHHNGMFSSYVKIENAKTMSENVSAFMDYLDKGNESKNADIFKHDQKLLLVRRSFTAMRILQALTLGKAECGEFGLWPIASIKLLKAMAGSTTYSHFGAAFGAMPERLHSKSAESCRYDDEMHLFSIILSLSYEEENQRTIDWAADVLSHAGAFRALGERK